MKTLLTAIAALLSIGCALAADSSDDSASKVCVLNFERPEFPVTKRIHELFDSHSNITIHDLAIPTDFVNCLKDDSTEILLIGHALLTPLNKDGKHPVDLAYFRNLTGDERRNAISVVVADLNRQITALQAQIDQNSNDDDTEWDPEAGWDDPDQRKLSELKSQRDHYLGYDDDRPYYVVRTILPQIMAVARATLAAQSKQPGGVKLKKIRLMSCIPEQVLAEYDDLRALIQENGLELDIAPANPFLSFIEGMPVTSPNTQWLKGSLYDKDLTLKEQT